MKLILYTGTSCPKCPGARAAVREACKEVGLIEGKDFVEKLIDGKDIEVPINKELDGTMMHLVKSAEDINENNVPAALAGEDYTIEALMHQVASTPSVVIDGNAVIKGRVPTKEELIELLK
ncbi:MAG: thioredoxin family protein [Candidatus Aenigmarchaeota archaeon]|nr:thioredoxin family protein [Candidatus Aenigmarchaeota archaeon]